MSGRTRTRRRIQSDIEETRQELGETVTALAEKTQVKAATKETVHDATARIKEAADRAAANAGNTVAEATQAAKDKAATTTQAIKKPVEALKEQSAAASQTIKDKVETARVAKEKAITEKTVDLREQAAKSAEVTQDLSARTLSEATHSDTISGTAEDGTDEPAADETGARPEPHGHLKQPTAERAARAATMAADAGGHLAHQMADMSHSLADSARHQLIDGRPADRLRRPVPLALAAAVVGVTAAIALLKRRKRR